MANPQPNKYFRFSNELWDALCRTRIPGEARQMLDVIIRKTYGFNKKKDRISTVQFMELTRLSRLGVKRARRKLLEMNLITVSKKEHSQILIYSIQKDYEKWILCPKKDTVSKKGQGVCPKIDQNYVQKSAPQNTKDNIQKTLNSKTNNKDNNKTNVDNSVDKEEFKQFVSMFRERIGHSLAKWQLAEIASWWFRGMKCLEAVKQILERHKEKQCFEYYKKNIWRDYHELEGQVYKKEPVKLGTLIEKIGKETK